MRRTLTVLAVLLAGFWGIRTPVVAGSQATTPAHQIADAADAGPLAFLRGPSALSLTGWPGGSTPRTPADTPRTGTPDPARDGAALDAPLAARTRTHAAHTARLALLRAGRSAFHTATPPPFRAV